MPFPLNYQSGVGHGTFYDESGKQRVRIVAHAEGAFTYVEERFYENKPEPGWMPMISDKPAPRCDTFENARRAAMERIPWVPAAVLGRADPRRMFYLLLPAGIFGTTLIPSMIVGSYHQDDRNFGGACLLVTTAPLSLILGCTAIVEAVRKRKAGGRRAFLRGAVWNLTLILAVSLIFFLIDHFRWFRNP